MSFRLVCGGGVAARRGTGTAYVLGLVVATTTGIVSDMARDTRGGDRHREPNRNRHRGTRRSFQPDPPGLVNDLDAAVGRMNRSRVLSDLIRRYMAGEPMPPAPKR